MLSTDSQIFNEASSVRARILEYGKLFEELHVIIYTKKGTGHQAPGTRIADNVFLYPTNSRLKLLYFRDAYRLAKSLVTSRRLSVITSQDPFETGFVAWLLKKKFNLPWQAQVHTDFLSPYFRKSSLKHLLRSLFGVWLIRKADRIRVVSNKIKDSISAVNPRLSERITVLPIFVDWQVFAREKRNEQLAEKYKPNGEFLILTVSRREEEKNLNLASEIVEGLSDRGNKVRWILVGSGSQKNIPNATEGAGAPIHFYKIADLFLLTSNYEGYGMAAVEAAAAGVPVVMTDVGVAIGETFPVGAKDRAVSIIEGLIQDPEKRKLLVERQNEFFKNWPTKEQYLDQYRESLTF